MRPRASFLSCSTILSILLYTVFAVVAPAQTFTKLATLNETTGVSPQSPLVQGVDGNLYGTAIASGAFGGGTFFQFVSPGTVNALYNFCINDVPNCPDGASPSGQIALGRDGNFYGTTEGGFYEQEGNGSIYKMTPTGSMTEIYNFSSCPPCAAFPASGLTLAEEDAFFFGSAPPDAAVPSDFDNLIYRISVDGVGTFHPILVVCPNQTCPTNAGPSGTLLQSSGGNLIGPGPGGTNNAGAIYRLAPDGGTPLTILYSFCANSTCHNGDQTNSPLVEGLGGNYYGTNLFGGAGANCTLSQGCGTAFRVTPQGGGSLTKLHDFCSWLHCGDGSAPSALIQATDGDFYGTTASGGSSGLGTAFSITAGGHFTLLHSFTSADGGAPTTALLQATDGNLYGTTNAGIFRISLGLPPFVKTVQIAGTLNASIIILGNGLTGATKVTFGGTAASFSVVSDNEITAGVPSFAETPDFIQVVTPGETLISNVPFVILR